MYVKKGPGKGRPGSAGRLGDRVGWGAGGLGGWGAGGPKLFKWSKKIVLPGLF